MKKKFRILTFFMFLGLAIIAGLVFFNMNKLAKHNHTKPSVNSSEKEDKIDENKEDAEDSIYGEEMNNFASNEIYSLKIEAEYATIHVLYDESVSDVEVFTQVGDSTDQITVKKEENLLHITQSSPTEDEGTYNCFVEVRVPSGKNFEKFSLNQLGGNTSILLDGTIENCVLKNAGGNLTIERIEGNQANLVIDSGDLTVKYLSVPMVKLAVNSGSAEVIRLCGLQDMIVENISGSVDLALDNPVTNYDLILTTQSGEFELEGEKIQDTSIYHKDGGPRIEANTISGTVNLTQYEE